MCLLASISPKADSLFAVEGLSWITNSTFYAAAVVLAVVGFVQVSLRRIELVPAGLQNFVEWVVETIHAMLEGIVGKHMIGKTFPLLCTLFIFILSANLSGLLPGVGTIGWGGGAGALAVEVHKPLLRPANADLNMTLALTLLFFAHWIWWTYREVGLVGFIKHLFAPKGIMSPAGRPLWLAPLIVLLNVFLVLVFLLVGGIEIVSIVFRNVSLPLRLYGNVYAGENLLHAMGAIAGPWWGIPISLPFYLLEILVAVLQALVFMLLCSVYVQLATAHGEEHA
jgi:F-type H+-transporting ATPase subunit a